MPATAIPSTLSMDNIMETFSQIRFRNVLSTVASLTIFLATGFVGANATILEEYSGEETFQRFCASCHGVEGKGDGPVAAGIPIMVPDLSLLKKRQGGRFPTSVLEKIVDGREIVVYHGTRYMPVWGYEFWVEEGADEEATKRVEIIIANLIDYIESIQIDELPDAK
jgi:hypothetical protein